MVSSDVLGPRVWTLYGNQYAHGADFGHSPSMNSTWSFSILKLVRSLITATLWSTLPTFAIFSPGEAVAQLSYPSTIVPNPPREGMQVSLVLTVSDCDGFFGPEHRPYELVADGNEIRISLPGGLFQQGAPCDPTPYSLSWPIGQLEHGSYVLRLWTHSPNSDERFVFFAGSMEFDVLESLALPRPTAIPSGRWQTVVLLVLAMGSFGVWVAAVRGRAG